MDLAIIGIDKNDGNQVFFAEGKTGAYFQSNPKIMEDLYAFHSFGKFYTCICCLLLLIFMCDSSILSILKKVMSYEVDVKVTIPTP